MDHVEEHLPFNAAQHMHLEHFVRLRLATVKDAEDGSAEKMAREHDFCSSLALFMASRDAENLIRG